MHCFAKHKPHQGMRDAVSSSQPVDAATHHSYHAYERKSIPQKRSRTESNQAERESISSEQSSVHFLNNF